MDQEQLKATSKDSQENELDDYERDYLEGEEEVTGEEEAQQTVQITEDQMLDIAESVFQMIADKIK